MTFPAGVFLLVILSGLTRPDALAQSTESDSPFGGYNPNYVLFGGDSINSSATYTFNNEHRLRVTARKGGALSAWDRGLGELDRVFPIPRTNLQGLLQYTNGYGVSLERYDQHEYSVRLGILFYDVVQPTETN